MTKNRIDSKLSEHTRYKKELKPPFLRFKMTPSSWIDERLPEMLWAVLVIGNVEREKALSFFRYIADYILKNPDCYNVTLSGIGKFPKAKRKRFIVRASSWSDEVKMALRPLTLFSSIPAIDDWKDSLDRPIPKDDWQKLSEAVSKSYWHQSQEATDCRWIRLFCVILGEKMKFHRETEDTLRGVFKYPNYGDMRHIRPFIRANEYEKYDIIHYSYSLERVSGMESNLFKQNAPKFYGAATVGERGQVVIPAEARRDFGMTPTTKLLVFGSRGRGGLMLTKAETVSEFIAMATGMLTRFEEMLKIDRDLDKGSK